MIKSSLENNKQSNVLYNSQVGAVIFMCALVYKISSLPGLIATEMHSSTLWLYLFMSVVDTVCFGLLYLFFRDGGDELLSFKKDKLYKCALCVLAVYLAVKCVCYFSYAILYLSVELFADISHVVIIAVFVLPVLYFGVKGYRAIARACGITVFLSLAILIINLVFLKTEMDVGRNLPVLAVPADEFFSKGLSYGMWLGDLTPLAFIKVKNKKLPYIGISSACSFAFVCLLTFIGIAMYGEALPYVENLVIRTAGFNQLSLEIGRMEWTSLFVVLIMGVFELALLFTGVVECAERVTGTRTPAQIAMAAVLILAAVLTPSLQQITDFALTPVLGYVFTALTVAFPLVFLALKRKHLYRDLYRSGSYKRIPKKEAAV